MEEHNQEAMGKNMEFEDSEAEDTLSFCDLPIHDAGEATEAARSSSDQDFFEFFNDPIVEICPAENIVFCGKLISYKENESTTLHQNRKNITHEDDSKNFMKKNFFRRRSESLNELQNSRSSVKGRLVRNNHSLDFRKLQRVSNSKTDSSMRVPATNRNPSENVFRKCDYSTSRASMSSPPAKSKWHLLMFGLVKLPPEMKLKDIRNRQIRRVPSSPFPAFAGAETDGVKKEKAKGSWRALRALSCKGHARAPMTAALGCIPYVQFARGLE